MSHNKDLPCSQCGDLMWRGTSSLPEGQATCRPCRRVRNARPRIWTWNCGHCSKPCQRPVTRGQKPRWCSPECKQAGNQKNSCIECGSAGVRRDSVRCSACKSAQLLAFEQQRKADARAARRRRALSRQSRAAQGSVSASTKAQITCAICTTKFIATWWGEQSTSRTCSDTCAARYDKQVRGLSKDRRRARMKNAYVADVHRMKIFERDRWQCHICNTRVKRDMVVPHPLAPTIDHLIPLAAGGTHEPANVATAHFLCNSRKGDRGAGEQLALIG